MKNSIQISEKLSSGRSSKQNRNSMKQKNSSKKKNFYVQEDVYAFETKHKKESVKNSYHSLDKKQVSNPISLENSFKSMRQEKMNESIENSFKRLKEKMRKKEELTLNKNLLKNDYQLP